MDTDTTQDTHPIEDKISGERDAWNLTYKNRVMMRAIRDLGNNGRRRLTRPALAKAALSNDNLSESSQKVTVTARINLLKERGVIEVSNFTCECCDQPVRSFKLTPLGEAALEAAKHEED
jgi:hypothetical protein